MTRKAASKQATTKTTAKTPPQSAVAKKAPATPRGAVKAKGPAAPAASGPAGRSARTPAATRTAAAKATAKPKSAESPAAKFQTVDEFMAYAYGMEAEATERYGEFADQMEVHNNREVAELFAKLARVESKHRDQIMEQMGWTEPPVTSYHWEGPEGPETADITALHYLMQPYHALKIAEHNERRAAAFFERLAKSRVPPEVRAAAREMAEEEHEHVRLIRAWLAKVPEPEPNWDEDLDPPALPE